MKKLLVIVLQVLFISGVHAQVKTVTGKITTYTIIPIRNAAITVKSSNQKYYSDSLGIFTVQCSSTDKLIVSAEGFSVIKTRIKKKTKYALINMNLMPTAEAKDLAIGYGHVKEKDKLYALSSKNDSNLKFSHFHNIYDVINGNFTGVQVINGDIIIRNSTSFGGSTPALLIVDGREVSKDSFANIEPSDIDQINILKDASASLYGMQGANGVVIVVTKRGGKQ